MYIPAAPRRLQVPAVHLHHGAGNNRGHELFAGVCRAAMNLLRGSTHIAGQSQSSLGKRQFSSNPSRNNNIKIGLIVGFVLAAFLAIVIAFLYLYCGSIRFTFRKKKHHHHHHRRHKSVSSKGSRGSDRGPPPAEGSPPPEDKPAD
ncbi:hypothetical protein ACJZ2D_008063 [Fusarium nematophilum]